MRLEQTIQQCKWRADRASKEKTVAIRSNEETPHPLLELRRDNMADLEAKINAAIQRHTQRGSR